MKTWFKPTPAPPPASPDRADPAQKEAYERGRRDERARRRKSPFLVIGLVLVAAIGGVSLVLAAREGSFRDGGAMMDAGVTKAAKEAGPALQRAADEAGEGLRKAQEPAPPQPGAAPTLPDDPGKAPN